MSVNYAVKGEGSGVLGQRICEIISTENVCGVLNHMKSKFSAHV
jgi:hypothetical protein